MKTRKLIMTVAVAVCLSTTALAAAPYQNYTYDIQGKAKAEPQAYVPVTAVTGVSAGTVDFSDPRDIFIAENSDIYIADTGNNRIVVLNSDFRLKREIKGFLNKGKQDAFHHPSGVYVTKNGSLYVADTDSQRVIALDENGKLRQIFGEPEADGGSLSYNYAPLKVAVDFAGRVYVASKNCSKGIIEFDKDGSFLGYYGAVKTQSDALSLFWKSIATSSQKASMSLVIPTEYSSIDIDAKGFIYGTVSAIDTDNFNTSMFIHKLNPMGVDVLKRNGFANPMGDVDYVKQTDDGKMDISQLCDVAVQPDGVYSVLDSNKGRVFTYNDKGELMFVYGSMGDSLGAFGNPVALDVMQDGNSLVLDNKYNQLIEFAPTQYASLILQALDKDAQREYDAATKLWKETLKYTSKSSVVFNEIGNVYNNQGDYQKAMQYYKLAYDSASYSDAYKYWRMEFLSEYFGVFIAVIAFLILLGITLKTIRKVRRKRRH